MPDIEAIIAQAREGHRVLSPEEWEAIRSASTELRRVDASLDHNILVLERGGELLAREDSDKGEIILRVFPGEFALNAFVERRVDIYERMWDGCGCKVDYYD